jgi:tetratricopeptide (TPR) repeat protein
MPRLADEFESDRMTFCRYCPLLLASLLLAGTAWGKDVDPRANAARAACLSGDYGKGVAILSELFVETKDADLIYNQGRCFEQNHRYEDAIARFQEFLRVGKKLSKAGRADAQKHIADCQGLLEKQSPIVTSGGATGGQESSKEAKERAARKACLTGEAVAGVAILTDLYLDTKDPTHLFNQGRCFEQNRRYEDAIGRFREYLEKAKNLSAEDTADTNRHIAKCESYLRQEPEGKAVKPEAPTAAPTVATEKAPISERQRVEPMVLSATPSSGRPGGGLRAAGAVVGAVGVAGVVTGLILNLKVNSMSSDVEADWNSGKNSTRQSYKTIGWAAYGAGAACVVGGALLYYLGWQRGEHGASIVPAVGPDMAAALLVGAF